MGPKCGFDKERNCNESCQFYGEESEKCVFWCILDAIYDIGVN